jgi:hypothetical protein
MLPSGQQLKAARRLLRVRQNRAAAAVQRPFRALLRCEAGDPSRAEVAHLLYDLYQQSGVDFGPDGQPSLRAGTVPGAPLAMPSRVVFTGDCNGRDYRVEVRDGEITGIWMKVMETFGRRAGTTYWMSLLGTEYPRRKAGRKLTPVIEETKAGAARAGLPPLR